MSSSTSQKRRRGRQPRPSLLSANLKQAVSNFTDLVGQPRVIEPAGFRDFRGWLAFISGPAAAAAWFPLVNAVIQDTGGKTSNIEQIKPDLVRDIVRNVVIPRAGESSKLVSTNCGRQCARPSTGLTLMTILDGVFEDLSRWSGESARNQILESGVIGVISSQTGHIAMGYGPASSGGLCTPSSQAALHAGHALLQSSQGVQSTNRRGNSALPSFRELEDSLQTGGSSGAGSSSTGSHGSGTRDHGSRH